MEDVSTVKRVGRSTEKKSGQSMTEQISASAKERNSLLPGKLGSEVDEDFLNYLTWHGLDNEENLLVLSAHLHYYYDYDELKDVKTLINLKKLNLEKHLDDFLNTINDGLSPKSTFIGCFSDSKSKSAEGMPARLFRKFINFLDARIDKDIDYKNISKKLDLHGFKLIDMTEINGLTYFRAQNLSRVAV
jgi:hypothetical protein